MKYIKQVTFTLLSIAFIGCGGGGSSSSGSKTPSDTSTEVYKNKNLPSLKIDTIPEALISTSSEKSYSKVYQKEAEESTGFRLFQDSIGYFYFKQMEMSMNLSYLDSVWNQVETYCKEKKSCTIPKDTIIFTYTKELYNHDMELIKIYEEKSRDSQSFSSLKESLKEKIGEDTKLGEAIWRHLVNSTYEYELKIDISNFDFENDELISIIRWNKKHTIYQVREELINGYNFDSGICINRESGVIYFGLDYNKSVESIDNMYTYGYDMNCTSENIGFEVSEQSSYIQKHKQVIQLLELANKTKLKEHISDRIVDANYNTPLDSYLEGELTENGGYLISSDTEGFYNNEKFDTEGNIISNISCIGDESNNLDDCIVQGEELIKSIVIDNYYKVGWLDVAPPVNSLAEYSAVFFNENNTLDAFINCSTFKADYVLDNGGIVFSNIQEETNSSFVCLDTSFATSFRNFLKRGYEFNDNGYIVWNGLMADLDVVGKKSKFDKNVFLTQLTKNRYVDSYTMNNLFNVTSWDGFFLNLTTNQNYLLSSTPSMHIQDNKIYIDLLDAIFEADINVVNNDIVQFKNIVKIDKENVVYPTRNCTNAPGPNECLDGDENLNYEDKIFTNVIEEFLNNDVLVSNSGVVDNGILWMHNNKLSFSVYYE